MVLTPEERGFIAEYVRQHNLPHINETQKPVVPKDSFYVRYVKRILDIVMSLLGIVVTLPVNLVIGIITYFDVGRPLFFIQTRPGKDCKPFKIIKFRNMRDAVDANGFWLPISERVTKFGSFVRRTSLDELLNFYSILKGDMSVIGPRPLATLYVERYSNRHKARHALRPGLECPNLARHGYSVGWHEHFENDIWYVENVTFWVDLKMFLLLFPMVVESRIRREHAVRGSGDFIGYDEDGRAFGAYGVPEKYLEMVRQRREKQ